MHELSLAESMIEQLAEALKSESSPVTRIEKIDLEIGSMSGVEKDAFEFVFPFAAEGTVAEGAQLTFREVELQVKCMDCGSVTSPEYPFVSCVSCGSSKTDILQGKDFKILQMEVS
ncbi:MAG: hydrogenase maturation nickel metallochaperone HypA [Deltaproteobacteria bacterium]|nr:hydrogenase maturation nickel metallochaperone HypA [Deltaproteobacteria bacterium]